MTAAGAGAAAQDTTVVPLPSQASALSDIGSASVKRIRSPLRATVTWFASPGPATNASVIPAETVPARALAGARSAASASAAGSAAARRVGMAPNPPRCRGARRAEVSARTAPRSRT